MRIHRLHWLLVLITALPGQVSAEPDTIRFGVLSIAPPARIHANWQPFTDYLSKQLGQAVTIVIPRGFGKMKAAVAANQVDVFYINSHVFYRLQQEGKSIGVAQMQNIDGKVTSRSEIYVRTDSGIESTDSYSVSHDPRAPLRTINGFCQALLDEYSDVLDETGKDYLNRVSRASQHMSELIKDLLRLSCVTQSDMRWQPVNLSELVRVSIAKLQDQQPERTVEINIAPHLTASGDPALLGVLMDNLTGNAWKYTAKTEQPTIEFNTTQVDGETAYYVKDNGVGFDMQYASTLFAPFQRLHKVEEFEGTGIGLATAQRIAHRHHGRIWAEARIGQGATFYFTLGSEAINRLQA